jgi:hypothetical protein
MSEDSGLEVVVPELRAAGEASRAVADGVRGLRLSGPATMIGDALPGGAAQQAGDLLAVTWSAAVTTTATAMGRHADNLVAAAQDYQAVEQAVASGFAG